MSDLSSVMRSRADIGGADAGACITGIRISAPLLQLRFAKCVTACRCRFHICRAQARQLTDGAR
jgi:hypothetical protein